MLTLADLKGYDQQSIKQHLIEEFKATSEHLQYLDIVVAYESVSKSGSAYYLFKHTKTGEYFEVHGSHCSCHGFENQFDLEPTTLKYLQSPHFGICTETYDSNGEQNKQAVKEFLATL